MQRYIITILKKKTIKQTEILLNNATCTCMRGKKGWEKKNKAKIALIKYDTLLLENAHVIYTHTHTYKHICYTEYSLYMET